MKKSKIYTQTGDTGETGLVSGSRVSKGDDRIDLYGEVDELNARVGLAVAWMRQEKDFLQEIAALESIQSQLFDLGSNLAIEADKLKDWKLPHLNEQSVLSLETEIDRMDAELEPLKNFILPGGTFLASALHLCRTGTRRVERQMVKFSETSGEELPAHGLRFINRLSDYFFVLARYTNKQVGQKETLWKPSKG